MNLYEILEKYALTQPDYIALENKEITITYLELWNLIVANTLLIKSKYFDGEVVCIESKNKLQFVIALLSLMAANVWVVPIPSEMKEESIKKIQDHYNIKHRLKLDFLIFDTKSIKNQYYYDHNVRSETGIYHLTSGSTGVPRLCIRTVNSLFEEGESYKSVLNITCNDRILGLAPIEHSYSLGAALMAGLVSGANLYIVDNFMPRQTVKIMSEWKASIVISVPIMIKTITSVKLIENYDFSFLRLMLVGAGALPIDAQKEFKNRFGIYTSSNYGSTETGGIITRVGCSFSESIGLPMPGVNIKLLDETYHQVNKGQVGSVYIKCKYMLERYAGENETSFSLKDGYFPMGDLMKQDEDGFYYVVGRIKNIINIGGKKIIPSEVEKALLACPGVIDCYVFGGVKDNGDELVEALVVANDLQEIDIRRFLEQRLNRNQIPSKFYFKSKIIRNSVGKVTQETINL